MIAGHGPLAERLCNKDPFTLKSTTYLAELFPKSKFILMIRDARATVHSIISRKVTITGFNLSDFRQCLTKWNAGISTMYDQCNAVICLFLLTLSHISIVGWAEQVSNGLLRAVGPASRKPNAKGTELLGHSMELFGS